MERWLLARFAHVLYLRFDERELHCVDLATSREVCFRPILGTYLDGKGVERVGWVGEPPPTGEVAETVARYAPFSHPRVAISGRDHAVALFRYALEKIYNRRVSLRPRLVLHPTRKWPGGLSDIERDALLSVAASTSASSAVVHEGAVLDRADALQLARAAPVWAPRS